MVAVPGVLSLSVVSSLSPSLFRLFFVAPPPAVAAAALAVSAVAAAVTAKPRLLPRILRSFLTSNFCFRSLLPLALLPPLPLDVAATGDGVSLLLIMSLLIPSDVSKLLSEGDCFLLFDDVSEDTAIWDLFLWSLCSLLLLCAFDPDCCLFLELFLLALCLLFVVPAVLDVVFCCVSLSILPKPPPQSSLSRTSAQSTPTPSSSYCVSSSAPSLMPPVSITFVFSLPSSHRSVHADALAELRREERPRGRA